MSDEQKVEEGQQQEPEKQEGDWNKEKQRADQLEANLRKKQQELDYALNRVADNEQKLQTIQKKLEEASASKQKQEKRSDRLPVDEYGQPLIKVIEELESELSAIKTQNKELVDKAKSFEEEQQLTKQQQLQRERENKILDAMDKEFGAKFRNEARELAVKKYNEMTTREREGWSDADAVILVRDCYRELAEADKQKKKAPVQDTGDGGTAPMFDNILPEAGKPRDLANKLLEGDNLEKLLGRVKK